MAQETSEIAAAARLEQFFGRIGTHLKDRRKRESFAMYAFGILGDGERKSAEPIAARACGDPEQADNVHNKLLHFLGRSVWDDRAVRLEAARYAIEAVEERESVTTWIVDDTGFLKQGTHSVGVQRQYTGSAGKVTNCQIGVSLAVARGCEQIPVVFDLYLTDSWIEDPRRRARSAYSRRDDVQNQSAAGARHDRARAKVNSGIPGDILLADSAYGDSTDFQ